MKWKLVPYMFIAIFSLVVSGIRIFMIPQWSLLSQFLIFILQVIILSLIWVFVKALSMYLDKKIPLEKNLTKRILMQVATALVLNLPLYFILFVDLDQFGLKFITRQFLAVMSLLFFVVVLFMTLGYNAFYFFRQWQSSVHEKAQLQVQAAELKMDKSIMQYHHLKNQVNPHFLFNTLASLDGLIQTNPDLASDFVRHLSKVYRYVLEHKEKEVVNLQTEIDFIQHYISLLKLRYKDILDINITISADALERGIVMVTLQMLIDNAIKHNSLQAEAPLKIDMWNEDQQLYVRNSKQLRKQIETSNRQGLQQLKDLYNYLSKHKIIVNETASTFTVILPLL